jgi:hypothetical protein
MLALDGKGSGYQWPDEFIATDIYNTECFVFWLRVLENSIFLSWQRLIGLGTEKIVGYADLSQLQSSHHIGSAKSPDCLSRVCPHVLANGGPSEPSSLHLPCVSLRQSTNSRQREIILLFLILKFVREFCRRTIKSIANATIHCLAATLCGG